MNRHVVAFLVAPLAVPLVMSALAIQILLEVPSLYWFGLLVALIVSYVGVLLVGAPVYMMLRSRGWSDFWLAPVVGLVAGVTVATALVLIFPLALKSETVLSVVARIADGAHWGEVFIVGPGAAGIVVGPGILGAIVGTVLWLIGRPDRP